MADADGNGRRGGLDQPGQRAGQAAFTGNCTRRHQHRCQQHDLRPSLRCSGRPGSGGFTGKFDGPSVTPSATSLYRAAERQRRYRTRSRHPRQRRHGLQHGRRLVKVKSTSRPISQRQHRGCAGRSIEYRHRCRRADATGTVAAKGVTVERAGRAQHPAPFQGELRQCGGGLGHAGCRWAGRQQQ